MADREVPVFKHQRSSILRRESSIEHQGSSIRGRRTRLRQGFGVAGRGASHIGHRPAERPIRPVDSGRGDAPLIPRARFRYYVTKLKIASRSLKILSIMIDLANLGSSDFILDNRRQGVGHLAG
jgi:hypothetical protein